MNEQLSAFARSTLKLGLAQVPEGWQLTFKRMYAPKYLDMPINEVVDRMPDDKLDWAMKQVMNSLNKLKINKPDHTITMDANKQERL